MITIDGAGLLAQVLPVCVLILVVEVRAISGTKPDPGRFNRLFAGMAVALAFVALFGGFFAESQCVASVMSGTPITAPIVVAAVVVGSWLIGFASFSVALLLLMDVTGVWQRLYASSHR